MSKWNRPPRQYNVPQRTAQQLQVTQTFYSGPIVHPEIAEEWEKILGAYILNTTNG